MGFHAFPKFLDKSRSLRCVSHPRPKLSCAGLAETACSLTCGLRKLHWQDCREEQVRKIANVRMQTGYRWNSERSGTTAITYVIRRKTIRHCAAVVRLFRTLVTFARRLPTLRDAIKTYEKSQMSIEKPENHKT